MAGPHGHIDSVIVFTSRGPSIWAGQCNSGSTGTKTYNRPLLHRRSPFQTRPLSSASRHHPTEIISFVFPGLVNRITSQLSNQNYPDVVSYYEDCLSPPRWSPGVRKVRDGSRSSIGRLISHWCSLKAVYAQEPSVWPQRQSRSK